jgi:hypothetical protein
MELASFWRGPGVVLGGAPRPSKGACSGPSLNQSANGKGGSGGTTGAITSYP